MTEKTVAQSRSVISQVMLPHQANPMGNVHGGEIMKIMDSAGGVAAMRHAHGNAVTLRVDELVFHQPIFVGELVTCTAEVVYVGNTSMEIKVVVLVENVTKGDPPRIAQSALFTFVALGEDGKTKPVPRLKLINSEEEKLFQAGARRAQKRKEKLKRFEKESNG